MPASDWLLREPQGTTHATMFVPNPRKVSFVLPQCWRIYGDVPIPEHKREANNRRRLRRKLQPVRAKHSSVSCLMCIGLGYA